jgi:hypothetical protein
LGYKSLPTTAEGKVLGYKGVQHDYWSSTGNADTIVVQGETNERHQILNKVGTTIEVARRCVDDNKDNHCSFGLHIGSYDYANDWAGENGRLLVVEFDPADAVSVPTDCNFQKLRVSKYKVVEDITDSRKELNKPVYQANKPIYGSDADDDYVDDDLYDDDYEDDYDHDEEDLADDFVDLEDNSVQNDDELNLSLVRYINKKSNKQEEITLKHLADLTPSRDRNLKCSDLLEIVKDLGYNVDEDEQVPLYLYKIVK